MPALLLIPAVIVVTMLAFGIVAGFSGNRSAAVPRSPAPQPVDPPEPEEREPEHSCVVKGLLRSLAEEPEWWEISGSAKLGLDSLVLTHTWNGIRFRCYSWPDMGRSDQPFSAKRYTAHIESRSTTPTEAKALYTAAETLRAARHSRILDEWKREEQAKLERFERMGCPEVIA